MAQRQLRSESKQQRKTNYVIHLVKQTWLLPESLANAGQQRRQQIVLDKLEAERLDRIRNPSRFIIITMDQGMRQGTGHGTNNRPVWGSPLARS